MLRREFSGYNAGKFGRDLLAGVTVAAVALPLALAFGVGSGASAAAGLVTAIIAGLVIGSLSGGSYQISGPTGAMTAILVSLVAQFGLQGVFVACLISGVLLVLAGLFRAGELVSFIPLPVITGFTSGIALVIALGQVGNLTGLVTAGEGAVEKIIHYFDRVQSLDITALVMGIAVIVFMAVYPRKWAKYCPGSLAAILLATAISSAFSLDVARIGAIPRTLLLDERLALSSITLENVRKLFMPAVSIAALGMIESLLCGASAGRMKDEKLNAGIELIAQGAGNILLPFFGGVPATAAIARTSVAIKAGGQTRLTSIIHSLILLLSMFALSGVMSAIPIAALAGVLMVTAWRMNEWHVIKEIFHKRMVGPMLQFGITMLSTVVFDLTIAIVIGVVFSVMTFVFKVSEVQVTVSDVIPAKLKDIRGAHSLKGTGVVYVTGPLYFGSVRRLEDALASTGEKKRLIFSMRGVPLADMSGVRALQEICARLQREEKEVYFSCLQPSVRDMFDMCGLTDVVGEDHVYWSTDQALKTLAG